MSSNRQPSLFVRRVVRVVARASTLVGLVGLVGVASEVVKRREVAKEARSGTKRVLVLPFYRMQLVESRKSSLQKTIDLFNNDDGDRMIEVEVRELVRAIHAAAEDPNIVALYGIFGHGFRFSSSAGWAQIEEVRNALRVFREVHRIHMEPNLSDEEKLRLQSNQKNKKQMYAFADSFANPVDAGNKEYYLASMFSDVYLQKRGELNLFGVYSSSTFVRSFLERYGIKVHVFKQGTHKTTPNFFTHKKYNRAHKENVRNYVESLDEHICAGLMQSRGRAGFDDIIWKMIRQQGTFTAPQALDLGWVDQLPNVDPLRALPGKDARPKGETKFAATQAVSLSQYLSLMSKRERIIQQDKTIRRVLSHLSSTSSATEATLSLFGVDKSWLQVDESLREKIALVHVDGMITPSMANKTIATLRKIKKDKNVKSVVLRVNSPGGGMTASETIMEECMDMPQPVVCSMGDVAASGGYYIASGAERVFALPCTLTGSIGVFGIKVDASGLARRYGIHFDHFGTGPHAPSSNPFLPLHPVVRSTFTKSVERYYDVFRSIVATNRRLPVQDVEDMAQGRLWTGQQAKSMGLVDEIGGLERAIAYAQRNYTCNGTATVEKWPKQSGLLNRLRPESKMTDAQALRAFASRLVLGNGSPTGTAFLAIEESALLPYLLHECGADDNQSTLLPDDFWV